MFFVALQLSEADGNCRRCMEELSKTKLVLLITRLTVESSVSQTFIHGGNPRIVFFFVFGWTPTFEKVDSGEPSSIIAKLLSRKLVCKKLDT
jgi:hypothetical protein